MERRTFLLLSAAVVLLALVLREQYVWQVIVLRPTAGDAGHYVNYAIHMLRDGYFGDGAVPDAYRSPGYPALIAASNWLGGNAYGRILFWQALLGTATVGLTIALARQWLPAWAALLAGLLLAVWPHHIAFSAELLTEVPYGFLLMAALLVAAVAKARAWAWACAGLLFALASMVNPVAALLPLLVAVALIGRQAPARWVALLASVVLIVGGWSLRPVDGGMDRAWQNLMQGSHPLYHRAFVRQFDDPAMAAVNASILDDTNAIVADHAAGLRNIARRVEQEPGRYAAWYAAKPWLLWDWDVRISPVGGPYVHEAVRSPLEAQPLRTVVQTLRLLNPALFVLALVFALYAVVRKRGPARMMALAFLYVTAVHVVLQAEPRYSIPYRPIELMLAAGAIAWASRLARYGTLNVRTSEAPVQPVSPVTVSTVVHAELSSDHCS